MRAGVSGSDDYLAAWRRGPAEPCEDDPEVEADRALALLEKAYPPERLRDLVRRGGIEAAGDPHKHSGDTK